MTSLADLTKEGGFVSDKPVKVTVEWKRGHLEKEDVSLDVWVRPMSAADFDGLVTLPKGESRMAATVAALVSFGEDGSEKLTFDQAKALDVHLMLALTEAVNKCAPDPKP